MLVALWCGQPFNKTSGSLRVKTGDSISIDQVNSCRKKLIDKCYDSQDYKKCFLEVKLGE
jgi:hypothetical protein